MARAEVKSTSPRKKSTAATSPAGEARETPANTHARHPRARSHTPRSAKRNAIDAPPAPPAPFVPPALAPSLAPAPLAAPPSPLVRAVALLDAASGPRQSAREDRAPGTAARVMELQWDDEPGARTPVEGIVTRWVKRGDTLLRHLAEHGAARHEYRADLKTGRFVWLDPEGRVSAEAKAKVLCSFSQTTSVVVMAWADPLVRGASVARIDGMPKEQDADAERAWRVAMEAADAVDAEYLYRVTTPHTWYFLALTGLTFTPQRSSFAPSTPVGLVLRGLSEARRAVESRAEPTDVLRERVLTLGRALGHEAEYAYRGTDWVARLERAGRRLVSLADRLPRPSFHSVAAGQPADEWLSREATIELAQVLALLEDEWALFA